jgi:hypothetical protein
MFKSVSLTNFRGLEDVTVPLSSVTILTGVNGVGKTSVLEGLYCLASETRLDVSPLSRGSKTANGYNYRLFWDECPLFGKRECGVSAVTDDGLNWEWSYRNAKLSDINKNLLVNNPFTIDANTDFASFKWSIKSGGTADEFNRVQVLTKNPGLFLLPVDAHTVSYCRYIDFVSLQSPTQKLSFKSVKQFCNALQIFNPRITDVRLQDVEAGLTVILDGELEVSLGAIGNGASTWANMLITIYNLMEEISGNASSNLMEEINGNASPNLPVVILIDEIGIGMHYSIMRDIWKFLRGFSKQNPKIQFVMTSHSDDCIQAFCEAFIDDGDASLVSLHRTSVGNMLITTEHRNDDFDAIKDGAWEVRG